MKLIRNIKVGKVKFLTLVLIVNIFFFLFHFKILANTNTLNNPKFVEINILDKISSKSTKLEIKIGEEKNFKNLLIKILKCKNSEFDDNPEVTAYLQVRDKTNKDNNEVFIFNGWTFLSSPSLRPFDHPVYDIWLLRCY
jgi:hypothetical protein